MRFRPSGWFLALGLAMSLVFASCGSETHSAAPASLHYEEHGVSFDYPTHWEILQSEPSAMGPTVIFNATRSNAQSDDLVLAMFIQLKDGESGKNDRLLQGVYAGHEALLDQALVENHTRGPQVGQVTGKETEELEGANRPGGFVIRQVCEVSAASGMSTSVERRFEIEDCAPDRVLFVSQQSTAAGRDALRAGLEELRETLRFSVP